jgi:hypothetical protein
VNGRTGDPVSSSAQKIDPALRRTLDRLQAHETVDVLVFPTGRAAGIIDYFVARQAAGELEFNPIELAGCIVLRGTASVVNETAARPDVARVTLNPTIQANADS